MQRIGRAALLAAGLFLMVETTQAGTILSSGSSVVTNGNGSAAFTVVNRGSTHRVGITKGFTSVGPIDVNFHVVNSATSPVIYNFAEAITNNTTQAFTSFTVQLGSGTGAGFSQPPLNGVMFVPGSESSILFSNSSVNGTNDTITFTGGSIPANGVLADLLLFQIVVPNGGDYHFTLRNLPAVTVTPEPSSLALAGLGGVGLMLYRRFRRNRSALIG